MFDIAATAKALGTNCVTAALSAFPAACREALVVVERMDPRLVQSVTGKLLVNDAFGALRHSSAIVAWPLEPMARPCGSSSSSTPTGMKMSRKPATTQSCQTVAAALMADMSPCGD